MTQKISDNAYAFALFLLAIGVAVLAHYGNDKDLFTFARDVTLTGAALFHGKDAKQDKD